MCNLSVKRIKRMVFPVMFSVCLIICGAAAQDCAASDGAQEEKSSKESTENDTLVVTGRLISIPGKFAPNDLYNYVYIMKYRILKVENGDYPEKELLVGQYNPLIPRDEIDDKMKDRVSGDVESFTEGNKHRLTLVKPIEDVWDGAVDDEFFDSDLEKYFAVRTDVLK